MPAPQFREFSPIPLDLRSGYGIGPSEIPDKVAKILARGAQTPWKPTGLTRETYLDRAELLVRAAALWQDDSGAIIDPVAGVETGQTSCRFVSSAAVLLSFGRVPELLEHVCRGMDSCCRRLASGEAQSPDFWLRELMTAWWALEDITQVAPARRAAWREHLCAIDAERHNWFVEKPEKPIESLHNWTIYAAAGEGMRELAGLLPAGEPRPWLSGNTFWEKYMPVQLRHFTEHGMYRDPADPFTYDMTTRLQAATPLFYGLETPLRPVYEELLRRGALAQLLYSAPNGLVPFGGRSNAIHLQEAIQAALGEIEARRYRDGDPALAGAFKRQAHLGVAALDRWLLAKPHRHVKNLFPIETRHGCEPYANYAVYSLFASSCLVLAALFADDSIPEAVTPGEIGAYALEFAPAFHKVFATCGNTQIEIDTQADLSYDATGLGRFMAADAPPELALAMPIPVKPNYTLPERWIARQQVTIGPAWPNIDGTWTALAELSEGLSHETEILAESTESVRMAIHWKHAERQVKITETYALAEGGLNYRTSVRVAGQPVEKLRLIVPLLETDGEAVSTVQLNEDHALLRYRGTRYKVVWMSTGQATLGEPVANRNGVYRPLTIEFSRGDVELDLMIG